MTSQLLPTCDFRHFMRIQIQMESYWIQYSESFIKCILLFGEEFLFSPNSLQFTISSMSRINETAILQIDSLWGIFLVVLRLLTSIRIFWTDLMSKIEYSYNLSNTIVFRSCNSDEFPQSRLLECVESCRRRKYIFFQAIETYIETSLGIFYRDVHWRY